MAKNEKRAKLSFLVPQPGELLVERLEWRDGAWEPRPPVTCGINAPFNRPLEAVQQDVLHVALSLHIADRCLLRPSAPQWSRCFEVTVPVYDLPTWQAVQTELEALLSWLTDDVWHLAFVPMRGTGQGHQLYFLRGGGSVALFSGGLDSLAGYVIHCSEGERPIPFGVSTHLRISMIQNRALEAVDKALQLAAMSPYEHVYLRIPVRDDRLRRAMGHLESSQRTRGLLHTFLAGVLANILAVPKVQVYENGVGAVNLPLLRTQFGAMSSRSVHPKTLALVQRLLHRVLPEPLTFDLPFGFLTKGQMVDQLSDLGVAHLAQETISCDSFPRYMKPCGQCTSCLLSRAALGSHDRPDRYDARHGRNPSIGPHAMATHMDRVECALRSSTPWEALTVEFPDLWTAVEGFHLLDKLSEADIQDRLVAMYHTAVAEWRSFEAVRVGVGE